MPGQNNLESQKKSMSVILKNSFSSWGQRQQCSSGTSIAMAAVWQQQHGSMVVAVAAQQRRWWQQCCAVAAWQHDSGNMSMRCYKVFMVEVQNMYLSNMLHMTVS
jgi:hypothetical protein